MKTRRIISLILVVCLSFLFVHSGRQKEPIQEKIERLNRRIKEQGLEWTAGETSMSSLSFEERIRRLGTFTPLYIDPEKFIKIVEKLAIPDSLSWKNYNGENWLSSIKNQGQCGSCWAFTILSVIEAMYNIENNLPGGNVDLSEQYLVSCTTAGDCGGGNHGLAAEEIKNNGVPPESCFPYEASDVSCNPCADYLNMLSRIHGYGWITQAGIFISDSLLTSTDAIMNALQDGPLAAHMKIYDDFYNYKSGIYEVSAGATYEGDHGVTLIGYDKNQNCWICKNSWGTSWGEDGYFKIRVGAADIGKWILQVWGITLVNSPPSFQSIGNQQTKEGVELTIQLQASDPDNDTLAYEASGLPNGATFDTGNGLFKWTPSYTQSGEYTVNFKVSDGIFDASMSVRITVINVKKGKGKF